MYSLDEKVYWFAIVSRAFIVCLQFVLNALIPDHDAGVFIKPINHNGTHATVIDSAINYILGGLSRWDSQYFLHIAEYGYTYENTLAFFPLFPLAIRFMSHPVRYLFNNVMSYFLPFDAHISMHSSLVLCGVVLNYYLFVRTAVGLYKLSLLVLKNEKLSYRSAVLFCINPASIFFSAVYSESLYCYLIVNALLHVELRNFTLASLIIGLSGLTRSNGLINIGFTCYASIKHLIDTGRWLTVVALPFHVALSCLPFALYQVFGYLKYCYPGNATMPSHVRSYGVENDFIFPGGNSSPWCGQTLPLPYTYVQSHYWNVGFLQYYQIKQIPNFALAFPALVLVIGGCTRYGKVHKWSLAYLGLLRSSEADKRVALPVSTTLVYVAHVFALSVFAALVIHVQVATRLLFSSSPVPYWFSAWFVVDKVEVLSDVRNVGDPTYIKNSLKYDSIERYSNRKSKWRVWLLTEVLGGTRLLIKYYYLSYFIVGTLMFCNFLPWT